MSRAVTPPPYKNRQQAGQVLASSLLAYAGRPETVVLGLPRGGVPVAYEVARRLELPLDVLVVRKLGVPGYEELAMGAISSGGGSFLDTKLVQSLGVSEEQVAEVRRKETHELARRESAYHGQMSALALEGKTVLLVDDGFATGATMLAAIRAVRSLVAREVLVAVPVGSAEACAAAAREADRVVCVWTPPAFHSVGRWYEDFSPTRDDEVRALLALAAGSRQGAV